MSSRTILSAHYTGILPLSLTRAPTHTNGVHCTQFTTLTKIINRGLNNRGKHGASIVLEKKKCFGVGFEGVQMRTLEAESIVSIAESKGGCVKLETVTERQDGAVHMIRL